MIVSAGFDAHKKDDINGNFIGVTEREYYWLTQQLVALANTVCQGRLVSALEGGYRIQGGVVSAFARSVAAHVRALHEFNGQVGRESLLSPDDIVFLERLKQEITGTGLSWTMTSSGADLEPR